MRRLLWLIFLLFWAGVVTAAPPLAVPPALAPPVLYQQVAGGEEEVEVPPKTTLNRLALEKGLQWQVVARHNDMKKPYKLKPGMVIKVNTTHIVPTELGQGLVINLPELMLYHFQGGAYQRRYSLAVGRRSWPTPTGNYRLLNKTINPTWTVPPSIQEEMANAGLEVLEKVPPGPKNPLGAYWMGTSAPGVGIHATNRPWSVGSSVSHGCIRMLPEEIAQLFPQLEVGVPVKIIYRPVKLALTPEGRIYLEALPNIYRQKLDYQAYVEELARLFQLEGLIDWEKVPKILKAREGIAQDITKGPASLKPDTTEAASVRPKPKEIGLSPLQGSEPKLE
ncbi:MAG: L,D-transpeptidase [Desulfobaccales bacterium]|nr:L,D-transpeptidase [Desulfobaccales bacterium]